MSFTAFAQYSHIVGDQFGERGCPQSEEQNGDYEAGVVTIGSERWRLRTARVTPKKPGAFVAVWRRDERGETCPFDSDESVDGLLVLVREGERFGAFRFPASQLHSLGITRSTACQGKRGFRVYPSWSVNLNPQAARTQLAQASSFISLR